MDRLKNNKSDISPENFAEPRISNEEGDAFVSAPTEMPETPEISAKKEEIKEELKNSQEEREEKDKEVADQLIVIDGAKIKFNSHMGEFKILTDVPTTQDKLTGTIVEKQIPNFTFYDGFQMISLTEWLDPGNVKVQENEVLIKKSKLPGVGKLPGNVPPETASIEFVVSGQVHAPEKITTEAAPLPENIAAEVFVEFEPLTTYDGEFGFDWIRCDNSDNILKIQTDDISNLEYVFDESKIEYTSVAAVPAVKDKIKKDYNKVLLKVPYYAHWLSLMHIGQEIKLNMISKPVTAGEDITKEEISFSKNDYYEVIIDGQKNEGIKYIPDGKPKEITIKCVKPSKEIDIIITDKIGKTIGKITAKDNTKIYDLPVRLVCVVKDTPNKETEIAQLIADFKTEKIEDYLNNNSLNQALIKTSVEIDSKYKIAFDETTWAGTFYDKTNNLFINRKNSDGSKVTYIDDDGVEQKDAEYEHILDKFLRDYKTAFETDGKKFKGILLFITNINKDPNDKEGGVSRTQPVNFREAIVFASNLKDKSTYAHEIAHALGLEHYFWSDINDPTELTKNIDNLNKMKNGITANEDTKKKNISAKNSNDDNIKKNAAAKKFNEDLIKTRKAEIDKWTAEMKKPTYPYKKEAQVRIDDLKAKNIKTKATNDEIDDITKTNNKSNEDIKKYNEDIEKSLKKQRDNLNVYKSNKYKFVKKTTVNIMDYTSKTKNYTQWQWKIMQNDVISYYGSITENK